MMADGGSSLIGSGGLAPPAFEEVQDSQRNGDHSADPHQDDHNFTNADAHGDSPPLAAYKYTPWQHFAACFVSCAILSGRWPLARTLPGCPIPSVHFLHRDRTVELKNSDELWRFFLLITIYSCSGYLRGRDLPPRGRSGPPLVEQHPNFSLQFRAGGNKTGRSCSSPAQCRP
jgi:hypothetical protein